MQPGWGISKKTNAHRHVVLAVIFLAVMQYGCGNSNSADKQKTSTTDGNSQAVLSNESGTTSGSLSAEQKAGAPQNHDLGSPQGATTARTDDGISSSAASHDSAVSGVENVSGPFGPFPPEYSTVSRQSNPDAAAPPPEPPETPRGPFGPFPASQ